MGNTNQVPAITGSDLNHQLLRLCEEPMKEVQDFKLNSTKRQQKTEGRYLNCILTNEKTCVIVRYEVHMKGLTLRRQTTGRAVAFCAIHGKPGFTVVPFHYSHHHKYTIPGTKSKEAFWSRKLKAKWNVVEIRRRVTRNETDSEIAVMTSAVLVLLCEIVVFG